ncbi:phosphate ABC transporter substrate-binding protein [Candidatus Haliotispira prima]|uniref:Phosphate ABC transporter substrate-binding protein n=1 Tax=Candidatus Haliotispira prima TaxID=3034016 RepID=A0ABY8MIE2_9SPIO|nr:phosphate ABC transporter substrate-binding protein [Candidatus Haliotispira prima]
MKYPPAQKQKTGHSHKVVTRFIVTAAALLLVMTPSVFARGYFGGSSAESSSATGAYALGGSTTVDPIIQLAIEGFRSKNPGYTISYDGVGSSNGVKGVLDGSYVLGGSSRELKDAEEKAGVKKLAIARDGMAVVTHSSTGVENLSKEQVKDIFTGKITDWKEVGGLGGRIVVLTREESSGTRASFDELALAKDSPTSSALVVVSNGDMALKLSTTPNSIGYIGLGYIGELQSSAGPILIDGYPATEEDIAAGSYPLARSLYMVYTGEPSAFGKMFTDYLLSTEGQDYVAEAGFLPIQ